MQVIEDISEFKSKMAEVKASRRTIGFVPTMGFLHEGHMTLIRQSVTENDVTVVSTFVNPAQFGPNMDFGRYPRDVERDRQLMTEAAVDYVLHPSVDAIYPPGYSTWVEVENVTELLDGASRPGYFRGICTVVLKLFNIVSCDRTYFGQKDYQQAVTIRKLIEELNLDIQISIMPIVRESDGLAMSSRNAYLNEIDRRTATLLSKGLISASALFDSGERQVSKIINSVRDVLSSNPDIEIDYIDLVDSRTMQRIEQISHECCVAIAVNLHGTRLIDNVILKPKTK